MCDSLMIEVKMQRQRTRISSAKMVQWVLLFGAAVAFLFPEFIAALKDVSVTIPQAVKRGSNALLVCNYDMENDTLYSVKWYKGRREFYRYTPKENPAMKVFPVTSGLNVERNLSNQSHVVLLSVPLNISGKFTCEISVEAPSFQTAMVSGEMEVVELPEQQATVTGIQPRYRIGDLVDGNCSIKFSKPAANLTWTINGIVVPPHHIKMYQIEKYEDHNLESVVSAINFMVTTQHFIKSQMKLKCTASIFNIYVEEIENIIEEDRPRIMASGRSYDMNAYPYDQHASGDGFEDHNESYLTYYSAADITSSAAPSARFMYVEMARKIYRYWTNFLTSLSSVAITPKTTSASLVESRSTPTTSVASSTLSSSSSPSSPESTTSPLAPRKVAHKTLTTKKLLHLPTLVVSTFAPLTPSSIKRDVKRFFAQFSQRFKVHNQIENSHKMEINVKSKNFKNAQRVHGEFNDDQRNNDDVENNDDDDDGDDDVVDDGVDDGHDDGFGIGDGDGANNSWHFSAKCIRGAFIAAALTAADIKLMAWSITGLSVALTLLFFFLSKSNQLLLRSKHDEWQQQLLHQFQQDLCCSCQNKTTTTTTATDITTTTTMAATTLTPAVINGTKWQLHPEHSSWLFNDFLSADQTYTLQDIKALKSFYNCQYENTNVKRQQQQSTANKAQRIDTIAKWQRKGCHRQLSMIIMMLLLLAILMTMLLLLMRGSWWKRENVQHHTRNAIENIALSFKTLVEETLLTKREELLLLLLLLGEVSKLTKMATCAFYENGAADSSWSCYFCSCC